MGKELSDVGQRQETNGDGVAGKEVGLRIQVVIVHRKVDGEARVEESADVSGLERGKRGWDRAGKVVLNLGDGKDMIEPSNVVDFSVPARDKGSSTACERSVQAIGLRPEVVEGGGNSPTQLKRSVRVGLDRRREKGLRPGRSRSVAFSP